MSDDPEGIERARASTRRIVRGLVIALVAVVAVVIIAWIFVAVVGGWTLARFD